MQSQNTYVTPPAAHVSVCHNNKFPIIGFKVQIQIIID